MRLMLMGFLWVAACSFNGAGIDITGDGEWADTVDAGAVLATPDATVAACLPGYTRAGMPGASCYRFVPVFKKWSEAESTCEADGPGAHLLVIDEKLEYEAILATMDGLEDEAWVGGSDRKNEGSFLTVTGAPFFFEWQPGAPDDSGDGPDGRAEDCAIIENHVRELQGLNDDDCETKHSFFCESDGMVVDPGAFL